MRFPEFRGEWKENKLEECVEFLDGDRKPIKESERISEKRIYPYYGASGIIDYIDDYIFDDSLILLSEDGANILERKYRVAFIATGKIWVNNHAHVLKPKLGFDTNFLSEQLERKDYAPYNTGTTMPKLNQEVCKAIPLYNPEYEEQKKIGQFLELVNERIVTQSRAIEKLQSLISGITQKFSKHPSVQKKMLSDVLTERNEKNHKLLPVYSVSVSEGIVNQVEYLGRSFAAKDTSNYNVVHFGDIVYTKSPTGDFPFGIVKRSNIVDDVAVSPLYGVYQPSCDDIGVYLHYYFCSSLNAKNYLHKLIQKGAKNTINITNQRFLGNEIPIPNPNTLHKYVGLMTSLSKKLEQEKNLFVLLQTQKQFLLREMFI